MSVANGGAYATDYKCASRLPLERFRPLKVTDADLLLGDREGSALTFDSIRACGLTLTRVLALWTLVGEVRGVMTRWLK